jgi:hypothetical protein
MGGVLFIDEAYYLYRATDSKDYGQECIDILLQDLSRSKDDLMRIEPVDILSSPVFSLSASLSAMEESFRGR